MTAGHIAAAHGWFSAIHQVCQCVPPRNMFPWVYPSPNPNDTSIGSAVFAQLTADYRHASPGMPSPLKLPVPIGDLEPHVIHDCLCPSKSTTQMASRSVHPFCTAHHSVLILYTPSPLKIVPSHWGIWILEPHLIHAFLAYLSPQPKWHLDRFSRF